MNIYKEHYQKYLDKGYTVVPDKYGQKGYALKGLSTHAQEPVTAQQAQEYADKLEKSNIAIMLGKVSGVIALDLDTTKAEILDVILPLLPPSPVEKKGAKGFTRFFRYNGEQTYNVEFDGEVVIEILSDKKKTTIPPSLHPSGVEYVWISDNGLDEFEPDRLPILPPFLIPNIEQALRARFPEKVSIKNTKTKVSSGRNAKLVSEAGKLIAQKVNFDYAVKELIRIDAEEHELPYFADLQEWAHSEIFTNAVKFYASVLDSVQTRSYNDGKAYEVPTLEGEKCVGKLKKLEKRKDMRNHVHNANMKCLFCKGE